MTEVDKRIKKSRNQRSTIDTMPHQVPQIKRKAWQQHLGRYPRLGSRRVSK